MSGNTQGDTPARKMRITRRLLQESIELDFGDEKEFWNTYKLSDGSTLKVKLILQSVKRLKKHDRYKHPIYVIQSETVVRAINIPKELMKK